jgi:hypothetical protein
MMVQLYVNETSTQLHVLDILRWDFIEDLSLLVVTVGWRALSTRLFQALAALFHALAASTMA